MILPLILLTAAAPRTPPVQLVESAKRLPMSDEGRAIAARLYSAPDPRSAQIAIDLSALRAERAQMIATSPIDIDRLDALLRKEEALTAEARTRANDRLLAMLRALPEPDRAVMLQNLLNAQRNSATKPAVTPTR